MPGAFDNSMVASGVGSVLIEEGRVINVDMQHWTIDVRTKNSQRQLLDMQVLTPYLHFAGGEGIFAMPEVGAVVQTCMPSDGAPFILGFCTTFEREGQPVEDEGQTTTQPQVESSSDAETEEGPPTEVTYRSGRPYLQQGDIMLRCRDGNQIWLHRGGVVEIGSTWLSKRFYIPLANTIRDVAENWEAMTLAGDMIWHVERSDRSPDADADATFTLVAKNFAQDQFYTVQVQAGHVSDTGRFKMVIAPNVIKADGSLEGSANPVFTYEIDEGGNIDISVKGDVNHLIEGSLTKQVDGDANYTFGSNKATEVGGNCETSVSGNHKLEAAASEMKFDGSMKVVCPSIHMGSSSAYTPVVLATPQVIAFFLSHTHSVVGSATLGPTPPVPSSALAATKLFGE